MARAELAPDSIMVRAIYPYLTETEFSENLHSGSPIVAPAEAPGHTAEYVADELLNLIRTGAEHSILLPA